MTSLEVVRFLLVIFGGLLTVSLVATIGFAVYHARHDATRTRQLSLARRALVIASAEAGPTELQEVEELPFGIRVQSLIYLARAVTGPELRRVRAIAEQLGVVQAAQRMVTSRRWWKRLYGARILTMLGPESVQLMRLFHDSHPLVRAQAAEWVTTRYDAERIRELVNMVYDEVAFCRFSATDALLRIGTPAVPALLERLEQVDDITASPLLEITAGIGNPAVLGVGLRFTQSNEPQVRAGAARVLGTIGGAKSIAALTRLLSDDNSRVRAVATTELGRLEAWKEAPRIAEVMQHDEEWSVRRAAAHALRATGAPGELLLRKFERSSNQVLAALAREAGAPTPWSLQ